MRFPRFCVSIQSKTCKQYMQTCCYFVLQNTRKYMFWKAKVNFIEIIFKCLLRKVLALFFFDLSITLVSRWVNYADVFQIQCEFHGSFEILQIIASRFFLSGIFQESSSSFMDDEIFENTVGTRRCDWLKLISLKLDCTIETLLVSILYF